MNENQTSWRSHLRSAFEVGKGKMRLRSLKKERQQHEQQKSEAIAALGAHAWEQQIQGEPFADVRRQLTDLEQRQDILQGEAEKLQAVRAEAQAEKRRLEDLHGQRIATAEAQLKASNKQLNAAKALRKEREKAHKRLLSQEASTRKALATAQGRLKQAESEPDAAAQADGLRLKISKAEQTLAELTRKLAETSQGLPLRIAEQEQRQQEVDRQTGSLDHERAERVRVLQPVEESLRDVGEQLVTLGMQQAEFTAHKDAALAALGGKVQAVRPSCEALAEDYQRIDAKDADLARVDLEASALEQSIANSGPGARRIVYSILAVVFLLAVGVGFFAFRHYGLILPGTSIEGDLAVRVFDTTGESVVGASTVLFFAGGPVAQYTDINGAANLSLDAAEGRRGRLIVESEGFRIHEQELRIEPNLVEVRLEPPAPEMADVVVRALDSSTHKPVAGAEVLMLANGDTLSQVTDSHGICKFTLAFNETKAEVQMSVESKGYDIKHHRVTLLPDQVQDINLDRAAAELAVAPFEISRALERNFREAEEHRLAPGTRAMGSLRAEAITQYTFVGYFNTPVLFSIQQNAGSEARIYDQKDFLVQEFGFFFDRDREFPFTPQEDGEYRLEVDGGDQGGTYTLTMAYVGGPPETRNHRRTLVQDHSEKGMIAAGAFDDFALRGQANKPVLLKVQRSSGSLSYHVEIFSPDETLIEKHGTYAGGTQSIPFTPREDGIYAVRILGAYSFGSYTLAVDSLETGNRESVVALEFGKSQRGELAVSAHHDYRFRGNTNTPLLITCQRSQGSLNYGFQIYDAQNRRIAEHGTFGGSTVEVPFTPPEDGEYRLRIYGSYHFGSYLLTMDFLDGPPETRDQVQPLPVGGSHDGRIGAGAYDEYSVAGRAGQPLVLTLQRQSGNLGYSIRIIDAEGIEVANPGTFGGGIQQIPFTPVVDGTLRVRVTANPQFGSYVISLNEG